MNTKTDKLSNELGVDLAAIRLAVGKLTGAHQPWDAESPVDLIDQGDRMVRCYENWLLDNEQKQIFSMQPGEMFILYASSYLCDIGLTDGEGLPPLTKDFKDDRARAFFNQSLSTRSCRLIRDSWQDLGVPDRTFVGIIARVCLQAGAADSGNFTAAESEAAVIDSAVVNVPLLAACLQLCKAFDLKSPATILQIISHMPGRQSYFAWQIGSIFQCCQCRGSPLSERYDSPGNPMQPS